MPKNEVFFIRLLTSEFQDPRWLVIDAMPEADAIQLMYVKLMILAGKCNSGGLLVLHGGIPYTVETLSAVLRRPVLTVRFVVEILERFGFLEIVDGVMAIANWEQVQAADELAKLATRKANEAARKREERKNKKALLSIGQSVDASGDSPRTSGPLLLHPKPLDKKTTTTDVVELPDTLRDILHKHGLNTENNIALAAKLLREGIDELRLIVEAQRAKKKGKDPADYLYASLQRLEAGYEGYAEAEYNTELLRLSQKATADAAKQRKKEMESVAFSSESIAASKEFFEQIHNL